MALDATVARMSAFIRRNKRQVKESAKPLLDGIDVTINECEQARSLTADPLAVVSALATAGTTGMGVAAGTTAAVSTWGVASTGTAIGTLSGAAAESATMAALGGGSLVTGGGGVALGATALNFVTVGPGLMMGGLVLNGKGEKALTQAKEFAVDAKTKQADVAAMRAVFSGVDQRIDEMTRILDDLVSRAAAAIHTLEDLERAAGGFSSRDHVGEFQRAMGLTVGVRDVASTPMVDDNGDLNPQIARMKVKYRRLSNDN